MLYRDIINIVSNNIGLNNQSELWLEITKADIFSEICKIYRKTKPSKEEITYSITSDNNTIMMPDYFYIPFEVIFYDVNKRILLSRELQDEEYMRWNPINTQTNGGIFDESSAETIPIDIMLDNNEELSMENTIGYNFRKEDNDIYLRWKPSINGYVEILYAKFPEKINLDKNIEINTIFHELIALGVTIRQLTRRLINVKSQEELFGLQAVIGKFNDEYKDLLNNFNGYVNITTSTPLITPFDFLSRE